MLCLGFGVVWLIDFFEWVVSRPLSASSKAGCLACFSGSSRFCMISVLGLFRCSLPTLLSSRLSYSFLASSSASLDIFLSMLSCFDVLIRFAFDAFECVLLGFDNGGVVFDKDVC